MSRIARATHAAIRRRVEIDGHSVVEMASVHGCTTATIYRVLAMQRREEATRSNGEMPLTRYAWVQTRLADQSSEDLISALDRLQYRFERCMNLMLLITDPPNQDDAEARQQRQVAMAILRSSRADGLLGHMRMALALAREIGCKAAELRKRSQVKFVPTDHS